MVYTFLHIIINKMGIDYQVVIPCTQEKFDISVGENGILWGRMGEMSAPHP